MDILLRENETPGEGEWPLPDCSHTSLKEAKVGKMKPRKRRSQGNSQREKEKVGQSRQGKGKDPTQISERVRRGNARHYSCSPSRRDDVLSVKMSSVT